MNNQVNQTTGYVPPKEYTPQDAPPPNDSNNNGNNIVSGIPLYGDNVSDDQKKFVVQGYKDVWAAILFLLVSLVIIGYGSYNYITHNVNVFSNITKSEHNTNKKESGDDVAIHIVRVLLVGVGGLAAGILAAILSMCIFNACPKGSIITANVIIILLFFLLAGLNFIFLLFIPGSILLFFALLRCYIMYAYREWISFSAMLLKYSTGIVKMYPAMSFFNILWVFIYYIWTILVFGFIAPTVKKAVKTENDNETAVIVVILIFALFAQFWANQVGLNVLHVIASGVTATWYFCGATHMPHNPTLASTKRALTTSFGSICFGSLLVAILKTIRVIIRVGCNNRNAFVAVCAHCIIGCIENLLKYFNEYAFVYCAIYGYGYIEAAKKTIELAKNSLFAALFNNMLTKSTLIMFGIIFAVMIGISAGFASVAFHSTIEENISIGVMCGLFSFIGIFQIFAAINSCITALFVCLSEEPAIIQQTNPDFGQELTSWVNHIQENQELNSVYLLS